MTTDRKQLSFHVEPHPAARRGDDPGFIDGALKIKGMFGVPYDLQPGDSVVIHVTDQDGQALASATAEVGPIGFKPIRVKGEVIGHERIHTAAIELSEVHR